MGQLRVNQISNSSAMPKGVEGATYRADKPFQLFLDQEVSKTETQKPIPAMPHVIAQPLDINRYSEVVAQVINKNELDRLDKERRTDRDRDVAVSDVDERSGTRGVVPFQIMIEKAVDSLVEISNMEYRVNDLTQQYIEGKVSVDVVSMEAQKLNLAITFATTLITTVSQTVKELTQIPI